MILPIILSSGVIPIDNPVVPNAEHTSNKIETNGKGSVIDKMTTEVKHIKKAIIVTTTDLLRSASCSSRLNILIDLCPLAKWKRNNKFKANVVVRIPPPTELGEAPINIKAHKIKMVVSVNKLTSIVANPPLLVAVD